VIHQTCSQLIRIIFFKNGITTILKIDVILD